MNIDFAVFQFINQFAGKLHGVDQIAVYYSEYGPLLFGAIVLIIWFADRSRQTNARQAVLLAIASVGVALLLNQIIGQLYFRPRPFADHPVTLLLAKSADPSFPSDHATGSFALALSMLLFYRRRVGYFMIVLAALLGLSRIYVGTHYPLDILGGNLTAALGVFMMLGLQRRLMPLLHWIVQKVNLMEAKLLKKSI
ncbi:phosphatidic acid phosphatase [Paenibacillus darwinianus]|uniref:Phosphatidic acid phosphatase n=1 Tax=Paenibacillus darwinianus TaxID=1380763 RepID=A0A9W5W7L0_9BACL|nr:undecaprenyl-diphosphatase [Paenibacillus darwinianus]EXX89185.1 phosphatidic acid phosphatase [Paenibacillus darwinianus]EXX89466.1 phosphatidic acid phosphatase [Paenibacillus darwinianus]EXX89694.1 phosphatidic acid phosphatase [Paenibacillus darwinianus]